MAEAGFCRVPPDAVFTMKVQPKGDGRWTWEIFPRAAIARSQGAW